MTINQNIDTFHGLGIEEFKVKEGIVDSSKAIRLSIDWDAYEDGEKITDSLEALIKDPKAKEVTAIVIGSWDGACEGEGAQKTVDFFVENANSFPALNALFLGEMTYEESEISWINQANYNQVWSALPQLTKLQIRGGESLELGTIKHNKLTHLIIETGGLPANVITEIINADLPELEHLELWLGDDNYGWNSQVDDLKPILSSSKFPKLTTLALRNCIEGDALASMVAQNALIEQLTVLDLSLGNMGDTGAEALLASPHISKLETLDLHFHYITEAVVQKLQSLDITVNTEDPQEADDDYRYISVSE